MKILFLQKGWADLEVQQNNYCIYLHRNKINGKIYIGQTCNKPEYRWGKEGLGYQRQAFFAAIQKYGWENFEHEILETGLSQEQANEKEIFYIQKYNSYNEGYNATLGGKNRKLTEEEKLKISHFMSSTRLGKNNSQHKEVICLNNMKKFDTIKEAGEWCHTFPENISACCHGKTTYSGLHPETKEKLFWCFADDTIDEKYQQYLKLKDEYQNKRNYKQKKIQQFDLDGNFINEYNNCAEAAIQVFQDSSRRKGISRCATGVRAKAYGYIWKYIE